MKRLSLVTAILLVSQPAFGGDSDNGWSVSGNIRTAFISDDGDSYDDEVHDLATGGSITVLTPKIENNFQIGATLYTAQPLFGQKTDQWLTEHDGSSYSYLGEAYITGTLFGKTAVILGRKVIDTPFADSDDIGMAPNSFEVYLVQNSDIPNFTFTAGRVTKWAGHDAPVRGEFSD
ncbi:MAG TPA: porin, partial [Campylobacterales bacterium]|nr:porin [Campylobacterales bacterium]